MRVSQIQRFHLIAWDGAVLVAICGYAAVVASMFLSILTGEWAWLQASGSVLAISGWYVDASTDRSALGRLSFIIGTLLWGYAGIFFY